VVVTSMKLTNKMLLASSSDNLILTRNASATASLLPLPIQARESLEGIFDLLINESIPNIH
jgi:hypothetical protein